VCSRQVLKFNTTFDHDTSGVISVTDRATAARLQFSADGGQNTVERKIVVGLEDIQGMRLKCAVDGCNERVALLKNGAVSFSCRHGVQLKILDQSLQTLLLALADPQAMQENTKKAGFRVLLEFTEPVK